MTLTPFIQATPVIQVHALAAIVALLIGLVQFAAPKGRLPHRLLGWIWVGLMTVVALSSFWIHEIRQWGNFSLIHLLSILTLVSLPLAVLAARSGRVGAHKKAMTSLYFYALLLAGLFTLLPGRVIGRMVFGG